MTVVSSLSGVVGLAEVQTHDFPHVTGPDGVSGISNAINVPLCVMFSRL